MHPNTSLPKDTIWLVTGAAGFIGSHLVERLLLLGQRVVGVDNLSTGSMRNVEIVKSLVAQDKAALYSFCEIDIRDRERLFNLVQEHKPNIILHQAALGSVPRSISDPISSHQSNVDGFINILEAARIAQVKRFVYASSSSVYGDIGEGAKVEGSIGNCLSPYAATKRINEIYAQVYERTYGIETIGLRYFNVFGPRQNPNGPYAAVIPRWLSAMVNKEEITIYGDGSTSRDFCFVANVVQANILAASVAKNTKPVSGLVNIACGATTSLFTLQNLLRNAISEQMKWDPAQIPPPRYEPFRAGDIPHSLADITLAKEALGYFPTHTVSEGIVELVRSEVGGQAHS